MELLDERPAPGSTRWGGGGWLEFDINEYHSGEAENKNLLRCKRHPRLVYGGTGATASCGLQHR